MSELPGFLKQGEAARLFPVLSTTSKEGRATSILLSCLDKVDEFAAVQLRTLGLRPGKRTSVQSYTEVVFKDSSQKNKRPDGLIVVSTGVQKKHYLVEAKIGNAGLDASQIESYMRICKEKKLDGVITISNQYSSSPDIHPLEEVRKIKIKVPVYHWSWMSLLTTIDLMISNEEVADSDQILLMNELRRFLSHDSTGVKGFDRMPPEWSEINKTLANQGKLSARSDETQKVVEAWTQEAKDLCLILSRLTNTTVQEKLPATHTKNPEARMKAGINTSARDLEGISALHWAALWSAPTECLDYLLEVGATIDMRTIDGNTPLHSAARCLMDCKPHVIPWLLSKGASPHAKNKVGKTPWDLAMENDDLKKTSAFWALNDAYYK